MHNPQCLVLSLDFDGCTDKPASQQAIIKHVLEVYSQFPSIKKVIFIIGSLRQSLRLDISNAVRNSTFPDYISCTILQDVMRPRLQSELDAKHSGHGIEIIFDTFLQADIYAELDAGTSFTAMKQVFATTPPEVLRDIEAIKLHVMVKNRFDEDIELVRAQHLADCSKITMLYGQLHHIASHYTDSSFLIHFYDDKHDILHGINRFYRTNPQWIPENMTLKLFCHMSLPGHVPLSLGTYLPGKGEVNLRYRHALQELARMLSYRSIEEGFSDLKAYLEEAINPTPEPLEPPRYSLDLEETEYAKIAIPHEYETEEAAILAYQALIDEGRQILEGDIQLELEFFNEYLRSLDYFEANIELYEAIYKKKSILEKPSQTRKDFEVLNDVECILINYPTHTFENELEEAANFAKTRCYFDERVEIHEMEFRAFKEQLCTKIAAKIGIPEEELLRKVEIFKNSNAVKIVAPKARKASPSPSLFQAPSSEEKQASEDQESTNLAQSL